MRMPPVPSLISKNLSAAEPGSVRRPAQLYMLIPLASGGGAERVNSTLLENLSR